MGLSLFLPETFLVIISMALLILMLLSKETLSKTVFPVMAFSGTALVVVSFLSLNISGSLFSETYQVDLFSQGFKLLLTIAFLIAILLSKDAIAISRSKEAEYFLFMTTSALGMLMLTSAADVLTLYVSLELSSYSLYLLAALRQGPRNAESSVKYLIFGAATSGVLLWGLSLIAGLSGTTSLLEIAKNAPALSAQPAFALGLALATFSFLFKLSGFPAHFWAPDVYESAATPAVNFIATASKAAAVAILIRVFMVTGITQPFIVALGALAFISMTLGNCVALVQTDVKRLLAYSSIAQAGYILVGLLSGSLEGYSSAFFYAFAYILMNAGAFLVTLMVAKSIDHDNPKISDFDGLAERAPFLSLILLLSLLSLAGIPPLVGFTGKWILFSAAMDKGHWFLVLWGVLNSVVSLFYYLTLVKHVYLEKPKVVTSLAVPLFIKALGLALFCSMVLLGIFPNVFITFAQQAIAMTALKA